MLSLWVHTTFYIDLQKIIVSIQLVEKQSILMVNNMGELEGRNNHLVS